MHAVLSSAAAAVEAVLAGGAGGNRCLDPSVGRCSNAQWAETTFLLKICSDMFLFEFLLMLKLDLSGLTHVAKKNSFFKNLKLVN